MTMSNALQVSQTMRMRSNDILKFNGNLSRGDYMISIKHCYVLSINFAVNYLSKIYLRNSFFGSLNELRF